MRKKLLVDFVLIIAIFFTSFLTFAILVRAEASCVLEANPPAGVGPFSSELTATFYNLPGVNQANMTCDQTDSGKLVPIDMNNQSTISCNYPSVSGTTLYLAFANASLTNCTITITDYDTKTINFDAWVGITDSSFIVGLDFPINVYVKNKGKIIDSYKVIPTSTANIRARIYDDVIDNIIPGRTDKTELEVTAMAVTKESMSIIINSTTAPNYGKSLTSTISSGMPSLDDIDVFSIFQIMILSLIVLFYRRN